jgi:chromosome transmission fidelity protein 18
LDVGIPARSVILFQGKTFDGQTVHFRKRTQRYKPVVSFRLDKTSKLECAQNEHMDKMSSMAKSLLPQPIFKMLQEIEDLKMAETLARTEAKRVPSDLTEESLAQLDRPSKKKVAGQMWTDRYRPTKYVDLLGDDVSFPSGAGR